MFIRILNFVNNNKRKPDLSNRKEKKMVLWIEDLKNDSSD